MPKKNAQKGRPDGAITKQTITPLGDRVLVRPISLDDTKTVSGIIIPDTVDKEKPEQGTVLAVGPGKYVDGVRQAVGVSAGDKVVFSKYGYDEVKVGEEEYYLIKEDNILAIIS